MKNLESFGVRELNAKEMKEVNGGLFPLALIIAAAIFIAAGIIANDKNPATDVIIGDKTTHYS